MLTAGVYRRTCKRPGIILAYKDLNSLSWKFINSNAQCVKVVKTRTYKFGEVVDTVAISKEAEEFLKTRRLLFDPARAALRGRRQLHHTSTPPGGDEDDDDGGDDSDDDPTPVVSARSKRSTATRSTRPRQNKKPAITPDDSKMTRLQKKQLVNLLDTDDEPEAVEPPTVPLKRQNVRRSLAKKPSPVKMPLPVKCPTPIKDSTTRELELLEEIRSLREQLVVKVSSTASVERGRVDTETEPGHQLGAMNNPPVSSKADSSQSICKIDSSGETVPSPLDALLKSAGTDPSQSINSSSFRILLENHFRDTYRESMQSMLQRKDEELAFQRKKYEDTLFKLMPIGRF